MEKYLFSYYLSKHIPNINAKKRFAQFAEFKLEDKFRITGRGLVLVGQIISGSISAGNSVCIKYGDDLVMVKIQSVEF